jgi:hypothetical protein
MVRKDGAEVRRQRIHEIAQAVLKGLNQKQTLQLSNVLSSLQYDTGLTKEKILEYLDIMAEQGQFVIDNDHDTIRKATDSQ